MLKVEVARGAEKSRRAAPRRWTVSGEGEGERRLEAARARLVVLGEAAPLAELELAADLGRLESRWLSIEKAKKKCADARRESEPPLCADRLQWQGRKAPIV